MLAAFLAGRLSYDVVVERLAAETALDARQVWSAIATLNDAGRLPDDVAAVLRSALSLSPPPAGSPTGTSPADSLFDEATIPHAFAPKGDWGAAEKAQQARPAERIETADVVLPPVPAPVPAGVLPPSASPAADALPQFHHLQARVDDAVLSGLIGDYKSMRGGRGSEEAGAGRPDGLNSLLGTYRSARFRSDARRIARQGAGSALSLSQLSDHSQQRAGIGSILRDRFILDAEIGRGGMGIVYSAVDRRRLEAGSAQPYVAVKLLNDAFRSNSNALRALEAEARKAQSLAHPNIATVYDFDRDKAEVFIVMELLSGTPLNRLLATSTGQAMPAGAIARILRGICSAIAYAHANSVVHSDLKPANVFVGEGNQAKVIDFGLATAASGFDASSLGGLTAAYASPEMFDGAIRDPRDDIFAIGCIAYQMLAGFHPFALKPANEARDRGLVPEPVPDLDPAAWSALAGALAFDRGERIASVELFVSAFFESDGP
ncbi:serine/threonine-protein kinase [Rhizobium sp. SL86]|uniref:serine/threonine-protein kinase n=1 Tax=Rhizobium sp. SL86 TaxID=2995148 RepID=UPI002276CF4A|nr:serine/threonine-protein kinase [Rhizobium sp. SL86]MCY1669066.1 serine/threonine-protein kinase [Rhizobium sp. SL86]